MRNSDHMSPQFYCQKLGDEIYKITNYVASYFGINRMHFYVLQNRTDHHIPPPLSSPKAYCSLHTQVDLSKKAKFHLQFIAIHLA